jgi:hypothetical protein
MHNPLAFDTQTQLELDFRSGAVDGSGVKTNKPIRISLPTSLLERRHSRGDSAAFELISPEV